VLHVEEVLVRNKWRNWWRTDQPDLPGKNGDCDVFITV